MCRTHSFFKITLQKRDSHSQLSGSYGNMLGTGLGLRLNMQQTKKQDDFKWCRNGIERV